MPNPLNLNIFTNPLPAITSASEEIVERAVSTTDEPYLMM
jgi:hypothetical protein